MQGLRIVGEETGADERGTSAASRHRQTIRPGAGQNEVERKRRASARQLAAIAELTRHALASADLDTLLQMAIERVVEVLDATAGAVFEFLPNWAELAVRAEAGRAAPERAATVEAAPLRLVSDAAVLSSSPGRIGPADQASQPVRTVSAAAMTSGVTSTIGGRKGSFGVIWVAADRPDLIDDDAIHFLEAVANVLAAAIERQQLDGQALQARRVDPSDRIAGQVAHDIKNLLSPLMGYPELIKLQLPPHHPALRYCDQMLLVTRQISRIAEDLLAQSRRAHKKEDVLQLNTVTEATLALFGGLPDGLAIDLDLATDLASIRGDATQLQRAIANLIRNARDAMEDRGRLTIRTANVEIDRPATGAYPIGPGRYVRLDVSDTGPGIPPAIQRKIFEPFFTTKQGTPLRGTGLGLSIVRAVVEDHRGIIEVNSEPGKGATFRLCLPADSQ